MPLGNTGQAQAPAPYCRVGNPRPTPPGLEHVRTAGCRSEWMHECVRGRFLRAHTCMEAHRAGTDTHRHQHQDEGRQPHL